MTLYLEIEHDQTLDTEVFISGVTGTGGITLLRDGTNLGTSDENVQTSRSLDSFNLHVTGATRNTREIQLSFLCEGNTLQSIQAIIDRFTVMADKIGRRGQGTMYYRSATGTQVTRYKVADMKVSNYGAIEDYESSYRVRLAVSLLVDPLGIPWGWGFSDNFSYNTLATQGRYNRGGSDYTQVTGQQAFIYSPGALTTDPAFPTQQHGVYITGPGKTWEGRDFEITGKFTAGPNIGANFKARVGVGDFSSWTLSAYYLSGVLYVEGPNLIQSSIATSTITANQTFWVVLRRNGDVAVAELWTKEPSQCGTPTYTVTLAGVTSELAMIDALATSPKALVTIVAGGATVGSSVNEIKLVGYKFRNYVFPQAVRLRTALHNGSDNLTLIPPGFTGTSDAQAAVNFTMNNPGANAPQWMMLAWWPIPPKHNLVWNGDAENIGSGVTAYGWQTAAYSTLTAAATSITEVSTAAKVRSGSWAFEVVCPATNNTGVAFPVYSKAGFKAGVPYQFSVWVRSDTATTSIRAAAGTSSSNRGISVSKALSTSWQQLTGAFIPAVDTDEVAVAVAIQAATATTFQFDDVVFYEDYSIAGSGLPTFTPGGYGPGIIPAIGYDSAKASVATDGTFFTKATPGSTTISSIMSGTGVMGTTANLEYHILPHLFQADEFTASEVDIAVFVKVQQATTQNVTATISVVPDNGTFFGSAKYSEFYSAGKLLTIPGSTNWKLHYLGTVTVKINKNEPQRMKLRLSFTNTGGSTGAFAIDYAVAVPSKCIASSRSGVQSSFVPAFIPQSSAEITKRVASDLSVLTKSIGSSGAQRQAGYPDSSLLLNRIMLPKDGCDLLVFPSNQVCDLQDAASLSSMVATYTGTVQVEVQPQVHLLNQ